MKKTFLKTAAVIAIPLAALLACNSTRTNTTNTSDSTTTTKDSAGMDGMDNSSGSDTAGMVSATISGTKTDTTVNGTARFESSGDGVHMHLELTVPQKANSSVAVHFHAMGDCGDMGKMAGGHWNPTNEQHGKWAGSSYHSGDIGNVNLDGNGKGSIDVTTKRWSLGGDSTTNIVGKTIVVHSGVDDYTSQPAGNSGERIGCGVIHR